MSANPILKQKYDAIKGDRGTTALVQTIRENESGWDGKSNVSQNPYKLSHDAGTGFGAYGYQKSSWKQWAKDYAGDENLIPTPENQDMIAYLRAHDLKKQYGKAADVLSVWNSGKPAAQASAGYNAKIGLNYDTPAYIQKGINNFKKHYDAFSGPITQTGQSDTQQVNPLTAPDNTTGVDFKNAKDAQMFAQKQSKYDAINQQAQQNKEVGGAYNDISNAAGRGLEGRVAELGTGLRRLGAKATNAIGLENNLDPNSPTYNPILDRNSATSQLAKEQYFKVPKGTPGKAWATAYDVASTLAPGLGAEKLAVSAPAIGKGLGLLAGDSSVGRGLVSKVIGRNVSDIPGVVGYLANKAAGLGTNILGGLAQTAVKEGGMNKKDIGQVATGTALSSALFSGLSALASGIRKFTKPEEYARDFVKNNPNKAEAVFEQGKKFVKDSLSKSKLQSIFGLSKYGKDVEDDALNVAVTYLPHLAQDGRKVDASGMYQAIQNDLGAMTKRGRTYLKSFKGDVYNPIELLDNAKQEIVSKEGGHVGFLDEAYNKVLKLIKNAAPKNRNLSAEELHNLIHDLSTFEFAGKSQNVSTNQLDVASQGVFKDLARNFRQLGRGKIEQDISKISPGLGNEYSMLNSEINSKLNASDIVEAISKDPTANKQFTDHMVGLLSGIATGNPIGYAGGRILSKLAGEAGSDWRFNKTINEPVFQEVSRLRNKALDTISKGKASVPKGKLKLSDIINQKK